MKLIAAEGWTIVPPKRIQKQILWNQSHELYTAESDGSHLQKLSATGNILSPIACIGPKAYRYVCQANPFKKDFSQIREFDLATKSSATFRELRYNQWVPWISASGNAHKSVMAIISTSITPGKVNIRNQLAFFGNNPQADRVIKLSDDSLAPIASCDNRREILFKGLYGIYRVNYNGQRIQQIYSNSVHAPTGRGGDYHPNKGIVATGGNGIHLFDIGANRSTRITTTGLFPKWDANGSGIWYFRSSTHLKYYDMENQCECDVLMCEQSRHEDAVHTQALQITGDQRYILITFAQKKRIGAKEMAALRKNKDRKSEDLFTYDHTLCILDTAEREIWSLPLHAQTPSWSE